MHSTAFALVEGNLARSLDSACLSSSKRAFETEIIAFPTHQIAEEQATSAPLSRPTISRQVRLQSIRAVLLLAVLTAVVLGSAWFVIDGPTRAFDEALDATPQQTVTVDEGASLWSLAEEYGVNGLSTQQTVDLIRTWNDLDSSMLKVGDELVVPA